jgi:hypothetical protein
MLSSHPQVSLTRRTYLWRHIFNHFGDISQTQNFERCLQAVMEQKSIQALQLDPQRLRTEFWQGDPGYARLFGLIHKQYAEQTRRSRWGDQLGSIERFAGPIFSAFPHARLIHMVRNPFHRYQESLQVSRRKSGKAGVSIAAWLDSQRLAKINQTRYPSNYKVVRYEALIDEPEATLRDICDFIEIEFIPEMLDPDNGVSAADREPKPERTKTRARLVSSRETAFMQLVAGEQIASLGYMIRPVHLSATQKLALYLIDSPLNMAGMAAWFLVGKHLTNRSR